MTDSTQITRLFVYGAGEHGRVIADSAARAGINAIVFVDDQPKARLVQEWPVRLTAEMAAKEWRGADFIVAIGLNFIRAEIFTRLKAMGGIPHSVIDPHSIVSSHATVGHGSFVSPGVIINTGACIGENCIINTAASIDHDCIIGKDAQVSPHACLTGNVRLGEGVMVGAGAIIVPGRTIGSCSVIGAGAVVTRDLPANVRAWGVPARIITD